MEGCETALIGWSLQIKNYSSQEIDHSHLPFVCISRKDGGAGSDSCDVAAMIATEKTSIEFQTYKTEMK